MKVRTRKTHVLCTVARDLWLTPHRKKVAALIVRKSDENIKNGKFEVVTIEQLKANGEKLFQELFG